MLQATLLQAQMVINIVNTNETAQAEPVDEALFSARYEMTMVTNTDKPDDKQEETMMLKVGKTTSQFYSYSKFLTDSLVAEAKAKGAGHEAIVDIIKSHVPKVTYQIYKNYPAGKVTTLDRLAMSNFRCEEENDQPVWELRSDTLTLLGYACRKATCRFKGREYEAWYTTDIARSEGPWKLYGLPGLILKANDTEGHYSFECTALIRHGEGEKILFTGKEHEPISRKNLRKTFERYYADPVGFVTSAAPNVTVKIQTEDGQAQKAPKNIPFNPIELE